MASIRKLPNGKWQGQFRPVAGGRQITRTSVRKATVQRWLDEQTAKVVTGTYADPRGGRLTLRVFYDDWSQRQIWETGTLKAMNLAVYSAPFLELPLSSITKAHVEQWVKDMQSKSRGLDVAGNPKARGLAASTIHTRFVNLRSVLRAAVGDRKIGADPSLGIRLPKLRKIEASMQIPAAEQVRQIQNAADPHYRALLALCAFAGLRLGEAAALKVGDIDFLRRSIEVRRQVQRENANSVDIRAPKHGSERTVAAADGLLVILSQHIDLRALQGQPEAWMFPGERGNPVHQNSVGHAWRTAKSRAKVEGYRLHDLRHFYASGLIAAGCDISTVQHALGHSTPMVTLNTYTHLWPKAEDRTRAAAEGLMGQVFHPADESVTNEKTRSAQIKG